MLGARANLPIAENPMPATSLRRRMTAMNKLLYFEKPSLPLHIGSTLILDEALDRETLVSHISSRLGRIPRYREFAAFDSLNITHPRWEHGPGSTPAATSRKSRSRPARMRPTSFGAIAKLHGQMLPRDRPLWKMVLIRASLAGAAR